MPCLRLSDCRVGHKMRPPRNDNMVGFSASRNDEFNAMTKLIGFTDKRDVDLSRKRLYAAKSACFQAKAIQFRATARPPTCTTRGASGFGSAPRCSCRAGSKPRPIWEPFSFIRKQRSFPPSDSASAALRPPHGSRRPSDRPWSRRSTCCPSYSRPRPPRTAPRGRRP